jgi:hypothetical protein
MTHTRKRLALLAAVCTAAILTATADRSFDMKPLKLEVPEMKPELVDVSTDKTFSYTAPTAGPDLDFLKSKTNPGTKAYRVMDDLTFVGVPLFIAGWAVKGDKAMFRVNNKEAKENTQLLTNFKTGIDDYTQFFGPAVTVGLKLAGYEGRSDWPRLMASAAMSYGIMAAFVNGIKYTAKEMRPDGTTANSWPSGHTATAFVGASLLHKEYGLTRSPWFSVAGYGVATATGVMRVLNNRHWISDVMSGAGIGIMSTELGYALSDILFKGKGLLHNNLETDFDDPSFFSISMGLGLGSKGIEFTDEDLTDAEKYEDMFTGYDVDADVEDDENPNVKFRAATVVDAEGAYFFNKYVGVGGRFRVRAMSARSFGKYTELVNETAIDAWDYAVGDLYNHSNEFYEAVLEGGSPITSLSGTVESDHLTEFTASAGLYFNLPLSQHFALGSKLLLGRSFTQELDIDGHAEGNVKDIKFGVYFDNDGIDFSQSHIDYPTPVAQTYTDDWDYLTIGAESATSWGTGLSLTYRYKSNFSWKVFVDYDYSKKKFTMTYDPYHYLKKGLTEAAYGIVGLFSEASPLLDPVQYKKKKEMNYVTLGMSFSVNF